jgi:UDP-2,4-diacetamido-2,4,6-trideoxy-beta-L-altropyranose hydrolase
MAGSSDLIEWSVKVIIRTDASIEIGTGHVMRCLTLAEALRDRGAECRFICREHAGNLIETIRQEGFECNTLAKSTEMHEVDDANGLALAHAEWLGASMQHDAQQTIQALGGGMVDWLVVDHYALDNRWEDMLRPHAKKIMVIDDLADRHHVCDLLLDQNLVANSEKRYQDLLPEHCATLLGPQYALLQLEYAELHSRTPPRTGPVKRIFVFFGGTDQHNLKGRTVSAFLKMRRDDIKLDVVVSSNSPHAAEIQAQAQSHSNITLHSALPSLAPLMLQADLAIGACGATSWERCCLGLPSLVITLAKNQKPIAAELHQRGLVRWLGHYDVVTEEKLLDALQTVIDYKELESWSRVCMTVTDGSGIKHVISVLALNSETKLQARLAQLDDEALLLRWANDPLVRANAFNSAAITADTHQNWFYMRLRDSEHCKIYIVETQDGLPIGQVRFELTDDGWAIDYSLDRFARGLGLGERLLETALFEFRLAKDHLIVIACVKESNAPSISIFDSLGFEKDAGGGGIVYRRMF